MVQTRSLRRGSWSQIKEKNTQLKLEKERKSRVGVSSESCKKYRPKLESGVLVELKLQFCAPTSPQAVTLPSSNNVTPLQPREILSGVFCYKITTISVPRRCIFVRSLSLYLRPCQPRHPLVHVLCHLFKINFINLFFQYA